MTDDRSMSAVRRKCIFVLGMHRSGTSAMAGLLHGMGLSLGSDLMPATEFNEKGYFENNKVFQLNEEMLKDLGINWQDSYLLDFETIPASIFKKYSGRINEIINSEYRDEHQIAIKDPRLSLLLPIWIWNLERLNFDCFSIIMLRHPAEVAKSFARRDGFSLSKSLLIWLDYNFNAETVTRNGNRIFINYVDLLNDPLHIWTSIRNKFHLRLIEDANFRIGEFIDPNLRHHTNGSLHEIPIHSIVSHTHKELSLLSVPENDQTEILVTIDALKKEHQGYLELYNLSLLQETRKQNQDLENEVLDLQTESTHLKHELDAKEFKVLDLQKMNQNLIQQKSEADRILSRYKEDAVSLEEQVNRLKSTQDSLMLEISEKERKIQSSRSEIEELIILKEKIAKENETLRSGVRDQEEEIKSLRGSLSFKIGWVITRPFGVIYDIFFLDSHLFQLLKIILKNPITTIKLISFQNIVILWKALGKESIGDLSRNLESAIHRMKPNDGKRTDFPPPLYHIDEANIYGGKYLKVRGWLIKSPDFVKAELVINGVVTEVPVNVPRPDVAAAFGNSPENQNSGFSVELELNVNMPDIMDSTYLNIYHVDHHWTVKISPAIIEDLINLSLNEQYSIYQEKNRLTEDEIGAMKREIECFDIKPRISIITPVYNVSQEYLDACVLSVLDQIYDNWELCLYDDASTNPDTIRSLQSWENKDERIKISFGKVNCNISEASNRAIQLATGDFIGLLDHDDTLSIDALFQVVKVLNKDPLMDFIYSDEDKIDERGHYVDPHFKSDYNPDLLLSHNYICHFAVIRKNLGDAIGWFRKGYEGSQDYDLFLRIIDNTERIYHIPRVLYHWRKVPGSTAVDLSSKNYAVSAGSRALNDYLARNKIDGVVERGIFPNSFRIRRKIISSVYVSIIIPFRDMAEMLERCVSSILNKTNYQHFEIILIDNDSQEQSTKEFLENLFKYKGNIRAFRFEGEFNYSKINNFGARQANGEVLLFLNNDTEVLNSDWLEDMVSHMQRPEVGVVGVKLLYPNMSVQHAGVIVGILEVAGHIYRGLADDDHGYFGRANAIQNLSACTGACLMVKRALFSLVGGFEEQGLPVAFNDIDLCLRIRDRKYLVVYTPFVKLIHYESISRGEDNTPEKKMRFTDEIVFFKKRWSKVLDNGDIYYNPNLSLDREDVFIGFQ